MASHSHMGHTLSLVWERSGRCYSSRSPPLWNVKVTMGVRVSQWVVDADLTRSRRHSKNIQGFSEATLISEPIHIDRGKTYSFMDGAS